MLMCDVNWIVLLWHSPILFANCIITETLSADLVQCYKHRRSWFIEFSSIVLLLPVSVCLTEPIKLLILAAVVI